MEDLKRQCPVCGAEISYDDQACPHCNFKLAGATQVFSGLTGDITVPQANNNSKFPVLRVCKGSYAGQVFKLTKDLITIGRDPDCDVFLNDMTVSREHCKLEKRSNSVYLTDMNSLNGTWVNGAVVSEAELFDGASLQVGTFVMVLEMNP